MKKGILIGAYVLLCLVMSGVSDRKPTKYWQDTILKPEQAWIETYGYNNESILAYNIRSLIRIARQQEKVITALKKELDALSDPNDINKFIPTWPNNIELGENLVIDMPDDNSIGIYEGPKIMILEKGTKIYFRSILNIIKDPNDSQNQTNQKRR